MLKRYPFRPLGQLVSSPEEESVLKAYKATYSSNFQIQVDFYLLFSTEEATTQMFIGKAHFNSVFEHVLRK